MDKLPVGLLAACVCVMLLFSTDSCRKVEALEIRLENGDAELGRCAISAMTLPIQNVEPSPMLTFTYNDSKNPVSVSAAPPIRNYAEWLFSYDKKGRLSQYMILNSDGSFQRWHVYFYDGNGRITGDSTYSTGLAGQRTTAQFSWFNQLFYDRQNRVVREIETTPSQFYLIEYAYKGDGNLGSTSIDYNGNDTIRTEAAAYVKQINVLLTNKIWRFLARDYSVNSHSNAVSYNEYGLPTVFSGANGSDIAQFFFGFPAGFGLDIQYDCAGNGGLAKGELN